MEGPLVLLMVLASGLVTWWIFFRPKATILVTAKERE